MEVEGRASVRIYYRRSRKRGGATEKMKDTRGMISQAVKLRCGEHDRAKCEYARPITKLAAIAFQALVRGPKLLLHMAPISQKSDSQIYTTVLL